MLRTALLIIVISGGSKILENLELLEEKSAWLVCGVVASIVLFLLPERGKSRDPKDLIFYLVAVLGTYTIFFKTRPWLTVLIGGPLATATTIFMFLAFAALFIFLSTRLGRIKVNPAL